MREELVRNMVQNYLMQAELVRKVGKTPESPEAYLRAVKTHPPLSNDEVAYGVALVKMAEMGG